MIKMVISPEYFGNNDKKNDIKKQLKGLGAHDINIDETTGFVTALMTQDKYENFVENLKKRVEKIAMNITDKYKGVEYIDYNPDYTVFNIVTDKVPENIKMSIVFELQISSATYQVISGIPQTDASIKVNFYDKDKRLIECIDTGKNKETSV
ncbi:MAG: hypothetical protein Q4D26_01730 [Clostridia bacterium]|nr:hypothetical protein [Clostridia bacterium]